MYAKFIRCVDLRLRKIQDLRYVGGLRHSKFRRYGVTVYYYNILQPIITSLLGTNILPSAHFSDTLNLLWHPKAGIVKSE
jgi:hypothetical protein